MIGIDPNILLPLELATIATSEKNHAVAVDPCGRCALHINQIVLAKALWTLKSSYGYNREHIVTFVEALLGHASFDIEDTAAVEDALSMFVSSKADFPDCLIFARNNRLCESTITFDRAANELPGFIDLN